jgi:predicted enzyme related to lactoylglutathione lyase
MSNRMALDGFALLQEYEHEENGVITYRGHGIFRWDRDRHDYAIHLFDSMGGSPLEYRGRYEEGAFIMLGEGPGGKARATTRLQGGGYATLYEISPDGQTWSPLVEAVYEREAPEAAKPGTIGWRDLTVEKAGKIRDFYESVAGWRPEPVEMGGYSDYNMIAPGTGEAVAGICHARNSNADLPPQWLLYVIVENVDLAAGKCKELGGEVVSGPRPLAGGRFCVIRDPAGAVCALYQP